MKKARLGFEIYSLDDELLVEEDKDFERREKDKAYASLRKARARKLRCWNKNKDKYNAARKARAATVSGKFNRAKTKALAAGQEWELTEDEWVSIWLDAGWVVIPGTVSPSNPEGERRTAYSLRGPNRMSNTMMVRHDVSKPWSVDNCYIVFQSAPLQGSIYHIEMGS